MTQNLVYAEFDIFCLIIMVMLTLKTIFLSKSLTNQKIYLYMMAMAVALVGSDLLYELYCENILHVGMPFVYAINIVYFISSILISYLWFVFSINICGIKILLKPFPKFLYTLPAFILSAGALFTAKTKWVFYFDENGTYFRGTLNVIYMIVPLVYFLSACVIALVITIKRRDIASRKHLSTILIFALFPICAVVIQAFFVGAPVICIGTMLGMLQVFLNSIASEREELIVSETASKSRNAFFAGMSHEIRTPINAILGMNTMILREGKQEEILSYSRNIDNSGKLLLTLVNDILDMSKIEAGKMTLIPTEYSTEGLFRDLVVMMEPKAKEKDLDLKLDISPSIPKILFGDEVRIHQIILNMISNAVKYTERGYVTLTAKPIKQSMGKVRLFVSVEDTGRGMRKEDIENLFAPYQRVDEKVNRKIEGTGLGMSISKNLLELMNSNMEVRSEYGVGSTFSFAIEQKIINDEPIGRFNPINRETTQKEKYKPLFTAESARVLAIDDTKMNLKVFQSLLKKTCIQIDTALSGKAAIEMCRKNKYDIIFIDIMMPEMDGVETLNALYSDDNFVDSKLPMIALTANALAGAREEYLNEGFFDYLSKPIDPEALEAMIRRYLPKEKIQFVKSERLSGDLFAHK